MAKTIMTTPVGKFMFPRLNSPESFNNGPLKYTVNIDYDPDNEAWAKFEAELIKACKDVDKKAQAPIKEVFDSEGEPTGMHRLIFRTMAYFTDDAGNQVSNRPPVVDQLGHPVNLDNVVIGNGTTGRIKFILYPFTQVKKTSVTLVLKAVQVKDIVAFNAAADFDDLVDDVSTVDVGDVEDISDADF